MLSPARGPWRHAAFPPASGQRCVWCVFPGTWAQMRVVGFPLGPEVRILVVCFLWRVVGQFVAAQSRMVRLPCCVGPSRHRNGGFPWRVARRCVLSSPWRIARTAAPKARGRLSRAHGPKACGMSALARGRRRVGRLPRRLARRHAVLFGQRAGPARGIPTLSL